MYSPLAGDILSQIFPATVQTVLSAGWTEDWVGGVVSQRRLADAQRCLADTVAVKIRRIYYGFYTFYLSLRNLVVKERKPWYNKHSKTFAVVGIFYSSADVIFLQRGERI